MRRRALGGNRKTRRRNSTTGCSNRENRPRPRGDSASRCAAPSTSTTHNGPAYADNIAAALRFALSNSGSASITSPGTLTSAAAAIPLLPRSTGSSPTHASTADSGFAATRKVSYPPRENPTRSTRPSPLAATGQQPVRPSFTSPAMAPMLRSSFAKVGLFGTATMKPSRAKSAPQWDIRVLSARKPCTTTARGRRALPDWK